MIEKLDALLLPGFRIFGRVQWGRGGIAGALAALFWRRNSGKLLRSGGGQAGIHCDERLRFCNGYPAEFLSGRQVIEIIEQFAALGADEPAAMLSAV